jgi:hypothetical protein
LYTTKPYTNFTKQLKELTMQELNVIKQVVQVAFASGKLTNLEEIKVILISLEKIEEKINNYDEMIINKSN